MSRALSAVNGNTVSSGGSRGSNSIEISNVVPSEFRTPIQTLLEKKIYLRLQIL